MTGKHLSISIVAVILVVSGASSSPAWGPHQKITEAAIKALPDAERWRTSFGADQLELMISDYCRIPDFARTNYLQDLGAYYANDYVFIRELPAGVKHHCTPALQVGFEPYFRRALQAMRTETPINALRQLGTLLHLVQDAGSPSHAKEGCPFHGPLEQWVVKEKIEIDGYRPRLLGKNEEEALVGLQKRMADLIAFSTERAELAIPLLKHDRAAVEPIILESALESARATADVMHTVWTLGTASQPEGASLVGRVNAVPLSSGDGHGARIVLLDSNYATLATTVSPPASGDNWQGEYAFSHLKPGKYRVLAYRTGSRFRVSTPIVLEAGKTTRLDFTLPAAEPVGNIVENPDAKLSYLEPGKPDRWKGPSSKHLWTSAAARVKGETTYRCGIAIRDPDARVTFRFRSHNPKDKKDPRELTVSVPIGVPRHGGGECRAEKTVTLDGHAWNNVVVEITTSKPLAEVLDNVWVAEAGGRF